MIYRRVSDPEIAWRDDTQPQFHHKLPPFRFFSAERCFVQPGVTQPFRKPVALPADVQLVDIMGALDYKITVGPLTKRLLGLFSPSTREWRAGVLDHTSRRVVSPPVSDDNGNTD
jgi:hypothetical protein